MARKNEPWFRESKNAWYVTIDGRQVRLAKDKKEAFDKFYKMKAEIPEARQLLVKVMDEFLTWTSENRTDGTFRFYREHCQSFIDFLKGEKRTGIKTSELRPEFYEKYIRELPKGRHNGSIQMIKRVYNWAIKRGRIVSNPIGVLEKPASGVRKNLIDENSYQQMIENVGEFFRDLLVFYWETGCRPQEAWRLKPEHVDAKFKRCVLPKKLTKRKKSDRAIYCNDTVWPIVQKLCDNRLFLFQNSKGTQWNKNSVGARMYTLKKLVVKRYAPYDFRHTWITRKVKEGIEVHLIAKLAGTSIAMIERHYDQSDEDAKFMSSLV